MPVNRAKHLSHYTKVDNGYLKDKSLSLKAKGLLTVMLSLPDTWQYSVRGLASICREGVSAIAAALQELETAGYVTRYQGRSGDGQFSKYDYIINEIPTPPQVDIPDAGMPCAANPDTAIPDTDITGTVVPSTAYPAQVITDQSSTQQSNTIVANTHVYIPRSINLAERMSDGSAERAEIRDQIDYALLCAEYPTALVDELVELMVEVRLCTRDIYPLSRDNKVPTAYLQSRYAQLTRDHVVFALDSIRANTSGVNSVKNYLLNVLYNAAVTMDNSYIMQVNRDDAAAGRL